MTSLDSHGVADAGDGLSLLGGCGREQRPGGTEEDAFPPAGQQAGDQVAVEDRGGAAAAGAAAVNILLAAVVQKQAAVVVIGQGVPSLEKNSDTISQPSLPRSPVTIRS